MKEEVKALNKKLAELSEEELEQIAGGFDPFEKFEALKGLASLEDVSGSEVKVDKLVLDSWDETTLIPDANNGKIIIG